MNVVEPFKSGPYTTYVCPEEEKLARKDYELLDGNP